MKSPIVLIIFNRPNHTKEVFSRIAEVKPTQLFIIADGPRNDDDIPKCQASQDIVKEISWDCEVYRNYSDINLGCGKRPATGISWVFEHVDRAIILEDDCIPHPDFFRFCDELLEKYENDTRVMQINGNNFQLGRKYGQYSYYFSRHSICWGWATWHRAWKLFDINVKLWAELRKQQWLYDILKDENLVKYFENIFQETYQEEIVSWWDHQWTFACWVHNGLSISPRNTLITNIGFGKDATHTKKPDSIWAYLPASAIDFPLKHPPYVMPNAEADQFYINTMVKKISKPKTKMRKQFLRKLKRVFQIL
jgi:hypothetical protein